MSDRARSFWGWGFADKFPDDDVRRGVVEQIGGLLGFSGLALRTPPKLEDVKLRASRIAIPESLAAFCTTEDRARVMHTYGRGYRDLVRGFRGDFSPAPDVVANVRHEDDIVALYAWASNEKLALVPYGGGTSVVAGVECTSEKHAGVVSVDVRAMDRVLEVDSISRAARIQAGATGPAIESQLASHGFTLRHFPQSFEFSTLGGWIVTRAGGHFATVYTHIDDLVESVRMITPKGVFESRRLPGSGAGPSPDRMVLGSEGILGIVTEAWMRMFPRPRFRTNASVHFDDFSRAVEATRAIAQSGLFPSNCRLLDAKEARLNFVTDDGANVLIVAFESADHAKDASMARAIEIVTAHGGRVPRGIVKRDEGERASDAGAAWKSAFLEAPYLQSTLVSVGMIADTFETACTWEKFETLHRAVVEATTEAMKRVCGAGHVTCRFTHVYPDGPAPYFTFLAPAREGEELEQWAAIKKAASDALIENGATITHHHAVGRLHRPWYDRQRPEPFAEALRATKRALDPDSVLNPGVLID